jgi:hypothetical protein
MEPEVLPPTGQLCSISQGHRKACKLFLLLVLLCYKWLHANVNISTFSNGIALSSVAGKSSVVAFNQVAEWCGPY